MNIEKNIQVVFLQKKILGYFTKAFVPVVNKFFSYTDCDFLYFLLKSSNKGREWTRFNFRMVILEFGSLTLTKLLRTLCPLAWSESGHVDISFGSLRKHVLVFIYYSSDIANKQPTNSSKTADK